MVVFRGRLSFSIFPDYFFFEVFPFLLWTSFASFVHFHFRIILQSPSVNFVGLAVTLTLSSDSNFNHLTLTLTVTLSSNSVPGRQHPAHSVGVRDLRADRHHAARHLDLRAAGAQTQVSARTNTLGENPHKQVRACSNTLGERPHKDTGEHPYKH